MCILRCKPVIDVSYSRRSVRLLAVLLSVSVTGSRAASLVRDPVPTLGLRSLEQPSKSDLIVAAELLKNAAGLERKLPPNGDGPSDQPQQSTAVFREGGLPAASTELSRAYLFGGLLPRHYF